MAHIETVQDVALDSPTLVEGLPGVGLVGKIAADHLVNQFEMTYYGAVRCDGLPPVGVYHGNNSALKPPVRIYADAERDLLVLQSDVPVSAQAADEFATCLTGWISESDVTPVYLSGLPQEQGTGRGQGTGNEQGAGNEQRPGDKQATESQTETSAPELYGIATGDGESILDSAGIVPPRDSGVVTGPTGALLYEAGATGLTSVGLIVESNPRFPDPEASREILDHGVSPIAGIDISTEALVEQAEDIKNAKQKFAQQMKQAESDQSSQAQPIRGFQ